MTYHISFHSLQDFLSKFALAYISSIQISTYRQFEFSHTVSLNFRNIARGIANDHIFDNLKYDIKSLSIEIRTFGVWYIFSFVISFCRKLVRAQISLLSFFLIYLTSLALQGLYNIINAYSYIVIEILIYTQER